MGISKARETLERAVAAGVLHEELIQAVTTAVAALELQKKLNALSKTGGSISVADYNRVYGAAATTARVFVSVLDHSIDKVEPDPANARMQVEVIGWSENTQATIKTALEVYKAVLKSQIVYGRD